MPNGELHEVSVEIGKLTAEVAALAKTLTLQSSKIAKLEAKVDDLTTLKHKGAGLLLGVSLMGTALGSIVTLLIGWYKG